MPYNPEKKCDNYIGTGNSRVGLMKKRRSSTGVNVVSVTGHPKMAGDVSGKLYYRRFCNNYAVFFGISCHI